MAGLQSAKKTAATVQAAADESCCAPEGSRTPNLLIRSQVLYPVKLRVHSFFKRSANIKTYRNRKTLFETPHT